ncbi:hypothetical protein Taro_010290 [Colocasia esculenta]|uniref:Bifunctional inhibitor/plant lipid transfer protein/seed storage helical domain-containing protein n=1 Tax=Colocasia esculenta TaxID=4460 RepID=A0A843U2L7_COLES|nr:hypothetical protein [Colocasia esculenta]
MASKVGATVALLFALNLIFFTTVSATSCAPPKVKPPKVKPPPVKPPPVKPPPVKPVPESCPRDTVKLGACGDVLNLLKAKLGVPPKEPCCTLLEGLADAEAAVCLCTVVKASVLGINLNLPVDLSLLLNYCGKKVPDGYKCS